MWSSTHLLAELEDGQRDGDHEGEEGQLQSVPGLQTEDTDGERDEGHGLEEDEHQDGDDDLLELSLAGLADGAGTLLVELNVQGQLIIVEVPGAHSDLSVDDWQLEGNIVGLDEVLNAVEEIAIRASTDIVGCTILSHLDGVGDLKRKQLNMLNFRSLGKWNL